MDADQIIQTARTHLHRLSDRACTQATELTEGASAGEYDQLRHALEACSAAMDALQKRLAKVESISQEPRP